MEKFISHMGVTVPLMRDNIDTDAIIPSREMKTVSKLGLGEGMFAAWRYVNKDSRELNMDFVLNKKEYAGSSILLSASNFGCGSSREHAVWALKDFGIRCVVAQSFGAIFARNCVRNGILVIELDEKTIKVIADYVEPAPQDRLLEIDLENQWIRLGGEKTIDFDVLETDKKILLNGLDQIAMTQMLSSDIQLFHSKDKLSRPWMHRANSQTTGDSGRQVIQKEQPSKERVKVQEAR